MNILLIIESPFKAPTIKSILGKGYKVASSKGHVRDLPKSRLGIDVEKGYEPKYMNIRGKGDLIKELKKEANKADMVLLATDPDREGEAISWHLMQALELESDRAKRITFNSLTKTAIREAIKHPRDIDMNWWIPSRQGVSLTGWWGINIPFCGKRSKAAFRRTGSVGCHQNDSGTDEEIRPRAGRILEHNAVLLNNNDENLPYFTAPGKQNRA